MPICECQLLDSPHSWARSARYTRVTRALCARRRKFWGERRPHRHARRGDHAHRGDRRCIRGRSRRSHGRDRADASAHGRAAGRSRGPAAWLVHSGHVAMTRHAHRGVIYRGDSGQCPRRVAHRMRSHRMARHPIGHRRIRHRVIAVHPTQRAAGRQQELEQHNAGECSGDSAIHREAAHGLGQGRMAFVPYSTRPSPKSCREQVAT